MYAQNFVQQCLFFLSALLLPPDHLRKSCFKLLRQPGLDFLPKFFVPSQEDVLFASKTMSDEFGRPYRELKETMKLKIIRIPKLVDGKIIFKRVVVQAKVDCWLTYEQYKKLTE